MPIVQDLTSTIGMTVLSMGYNGSYYLFGGSTGYPLYYPKLLKWDGVTVTDLTSQLIGFTGASFNTLAHIEWNGSYWLLGDSTSGYLNKYDGSSFTDLTSACGISTWSDGRFRYIQNLCWNGSYWIIMTRSVGCIKKYDGSTFTDVPSPGFWTDDLMTLTYNSGYWYFGGSRGACFKYDGSNYTDFFSLISPYIPAAYPTDSETLANPYAQPQLYANSEYTLVSSYTIPTSDSNTTTGIGLKLEHSGSISENLTSNIPNFSTASSNIYTTLYARVGMRTALDCNGIFAFYNGLNGYLWSYNGSEFGYDEIADKTVLRIGAWNGSTFLIVCSGPVLYEMSLAEPTTLYSFITSLSSSVDLNNRAFFKRNFSSCVNVSLKLIRGFFNYISTTFDLILVNLYNTSTFLRTLNSAAHLISFLSRNVTNNRKIFNSFILLSAVLHFDFLRWKYLISKISIIPKLPILGKTFNRYFESFKILHSSISRYNSQTFFTSLSKISKMVFSYGRFREYFLALGISPIISTSKNLIRNLFSRISIVIQMHRHISKVVYIEILQKIYPILEKVTKFSRVYTSNILLNKFIFKTFLREFLSSLGIKSNPISLRKYFKTIKRKIKILGR